MEMAVSILGSFAIGSVYRLLEIKKYVQASSSIFGIFLILFFGKIDALFFVALLVSGIFLIKSSIGPRFVFGFATAFQVIFNILSYYGLRTNDPGNMLVGCLIFTATMKVVILAYEVAEFRTKSKETDTPSKCTFGVLSLEKEPSVLDIACYMTCYVGLITGPIYKYRTYSDMIEKPYKPTKTMLIRHLAKLAFCMSVFLATTHFYDINYFKRNDIKNDAWYIWLFYLHLVAAHHICRYTAVWLFSDATCLFLGLGVYPVECRSNPGQGPAAKHPDSSYRADDAAKQPECDANTVKTMDIPQLFATPWFSATFPTWNRTVQWWLVSFVYRAEVIPKTMRSARVGLVFLVSALWHGIELTYIAVVIPIALIIPIDKYCMRVLRDQLRGNWIAKLYLVCHWMFKTFVVAFLFVAYNLLDFKLMVKLYHQTHFLVCLLPLVMLSLCKLASVCFKAPSTRH